MTDCGFAVAAIFVRKLRRFDLETVVDLNHMLEAQNVAAGIALRCSTSLSNGVAANGLGEVQLHMRYCQY